MEPRRRGEQPRRDALAGGALSALSAARAADLRERWLAFVPPLPLRSGHLQSTMGSLPPLRLRVRARAAALRAQAQPVLLDCGQDVRLLGFHSPANAGAGAPRGLTVLLHGWEGSADSTCVLSLAATLHGAGFEVLRLNLRDHGDSHHLNRELFHCGRLAEVIGALRDIERRWRGLPLYMAGFSLGGNFLLRAAAEAGLPASTAAVVAISPVLDPAVTLRALEEGPRFYRNHFIHRWWQSLRLKQRAWPGVHDFARWSHVMDLRSLTVALVREHTPFAGIDEYLRGYQIVGDRLARLQVPCHLLLADDDPLIPTMDLQRLARPPQLSIWRSRYGGHCGFVRGWSLRSAADEWVLDCFERERLSTPLPLAAEA
jgi:uncharacterized protein